MSLRANRGAVLETLLVVYHRPFWRGADGSLWEREGAFSRFVESLAPHFERIVLAVPEAGAPKRPTTSPPGGHRLAADNVCLAGLPFFDGLPRFFRVLPGVLRALWAAIGQADVVCLRLPTPAGPWAFAIARLRRVPCFLLVVGDPAGVAGSVEGGALKRRLYRRYLQIEEGLLQRMASHTPTITNGHALWEKYARPGRRVFETRNSTIRLGDVGRPREALRPPRARLLCVSRVDPRKGIRFVPAAMEVLRQSGFEPTLEVLGPTVGRLGQEEMEATLAEARRRGVDDAVEFHGAASLEEVFADYTSHDLLLVPSLPGEGIPRVLLEAMAAGLPIVATRVAGIPDLLRDRENGLLAPPADGQALGEAAARLLEDEGLRARCVAAGYETARAHTADAQATWMATLLREQFCRKQPAGPPAGQVQHAASANATGRQLRVTIPLAGLNLSGGVKSLVLLANRLAERGAAVRVIVPDYAAQTPVPLDSRVQLCVVLSRGPRPLHKLGYLARLSGLAAAGADLVLANYYVTAYPAVLSWMAHGRRAALAYNVRGYEPWSHGLMAPAGPLSRRLRYGLARLSYSLPLSKLVTTAWLARMVGDPGALVVGHGIDLEVFKPTLERRQALEGGGVRAGGATVTVGVIGRVGAVKGYPDFLAAVARLPRDLDLGLLVVEADPVPLPEGWPVQSIHAREEREMAAFFNRCEIFVFPSLAEGFGLPALEAMACGCAVVTTDCGGVSSFARSDENCLMVPPGRPELLADAIARLARDPLLRARFVRAGLETARSFEREASLDRLAGAVLALAATRSGRRAR